MKKVVFILISFVLLSSAELLAQPKMEIVGGNKKDWGEVKPTDSPLETKIKIKNIGNETLHITRVKPGCGCTTAPLDKDKVEPGDFAIVDVKLNVANYSNNVHKSISISTNDPENRNIKYHLYCKVLRPVQTFPRFINITNAEVGEEALGKVRLKNNSNEKITIKEIVLKPKDIKINIEEGFVLEPKTDFGIEVLVTPKDLGRIRGMVTIKTDNSEASFVRIPLYCSVRDKSKVKTNKTRNRKEESNH